MIKFTLTDEQVKRVTPLFARLNTLNHQGEMGMIIAQIHFRNGEFVVTCELVDGPRAVGICKANGRTDEQILAAYDRLHRKVPLDKNGELH